MAGPRLHRSIPSVTVHRLGGGPIEGHFPVGRGTIHGITDGNQYVTLFEASARPDGFAINRETATERVAVTALHACGLDAF
jgi:hypothetical protein